jgi:hypothetical protein
MHNAKNEWLKCPLNIMDNHDPIQVTLDGELYLWIIEVTK